MARHRSSLLALLAPVLLVAAACSSGSDEGSAGQAESGRAGFAAFEAPVLGGGAFDSASIEGRDTVLWFWAPWCTSCRAEAPDVVATAAEFEGSVEVIGVAGRGQVDEMEQFVAETGTGGLDHVVDGDGSIWTGFGVIGQPAYAFVDDSGEVELHVGSLGGEALRERMAALTGT